jgi:hypothetical protein
MAKAERDLRVVEIGPPPPERKDWLETEWIMGSGEGFGRRKRRPPYLTRGIELHENGNFLG